MLQRVAARALARQRLQPGWGARQLASASAALEEFRENVREFAQATIAPHAEHIDRANSFPADVDLWRSMGDFGLLGVTAPQEHGGLGLGYAEHCVAMEELSRASGSVGLSYGAHSNLCVNQLVRNASAAQQARYLPKLISGEHIGGGRGWEPPPPPPPPPPPWCAAGRHAAGGQLPAPRPAGRPRQLHRRPCRRRRRPGRARPALQQCHPRPGPRPGRRPPKPHPPPHPCAPPPPPQRCPSASPAPAPTPSA
jgi:hypothetical protein